MRRILEDRFAVKIALTLLTGMGLMAVLVFAQPVVPVAKPAYPVFVKVPYQRGIDELVQRDLIAGKLKFPEGMTSFRVYEGRIQIRTGPPGDKTAKWVDRDEVSLLAMFVFGQDKFFYDQDGNYFVAAEVYEQFKGRLIQHHPGRLLLLDGTEDGKKTQKAYFWDETDKVWRWPGLGIIPKDHVDITGSKLYHKLLGGAPPRGTLEELHHKHVEKKKDR